MDAFKEYLEKIQQMFGEMDRTKKMAVGGGAGALILVLMFLSWRTAGIALIPNVLPVAFYFGALGLTGVTLNFATSLIAPMALGIAIDDTIHYFSRFTQDAKGMADERRATVAQSVSVSTWLGDSRSVVVPSPNWPQKLLPQHHAVLSVLTAQM